MDAKKEHFQPKKAAILVILAALSFSIMSLFVKFARENTSSSIIVFFRFGISFFYILIIMLFKNIKNKISIKTDILFLHFLRAIIALIAMWLFYFSIKYIHLVEANLLVMTNALFIPILGSVFLHKKTGEKHWIAISIGFIGVFFILKPGHSIFNIKSLFALFAGLGIAISLLVLRKISKRDPPYVCMFYYFLIVFALSGFFVIFSWENIDFHTLLLLLGAGVFGTFYQEFLVRSAAFAPARITSSLLYTSLIFSSFFGFLFFKEIPDFLSWLGIFLVSFSSIIIVLFAHRKSVKK